MRNGPHSEPYVEANHDTRCTVFAAGGEVRGLTAYPSILDSDAIVQACDPDVAGVRS